MMFSWHLRTVSEASHYDVADLSWPSFKLLHGRCLGLLISAIARKRGDWHGWRILPRSALWATPKADMHLDDSGASGGL